MNKNDSAALIFAELIRAEVPSNHHVPLKERLAALAELSVYAVELLDAAIAARDDDLTGFKQSVRQYWLQDK